MWVPRGGVRAVTRCSSGKGGAGWRSMEYSAGAKGGGDSSTGTGSGCRELRGVACSAQQQCWYWTTMQVPGGTDCVGSSVRAIGSSFALWGGLQCAVVCCVSRHSSSASDVGRAGWCSAQSNSCADRPNQWHEIGSYVGGGWRIVCCGKQCERGGGPLGAVMQTTLMN
jgi:hypothetical protein